MATNKIQPGNVLTWTVAGKSSGDPVILNGMTGVALTDTDATTGKLSVDLEGVYDLSVKAINDAGNSAVAIGDKIFYVVGDTPLLSKKASGYFFGYALEVIGTGETATINVLQVAGPGPGTLDVPDGSISTAKIADLAITAGKLAAAITPSHVVKFAGKITWSGSGASLATTIAGVAATDIVICTIQTAPTQAAYIVTAAPTPNTLTIVLSTANTSNDAVIAYQVLRAIA